MISHHCSEFLRLPLMRRYFLLTPDISGAFVLSSHLAGCLGSGMWPRGVTVSPLDLNPAIAAQIRARPHREHCAGIRSAQDGGGSQMRCNYANRMSNHAERCSC